MFGYAKDPENVVWCDKCGRYFNADTGHKCIDDRIRESRVNLERWLGSYTIKAD